MPRRDLPDILLRIAVAALLLWQLVVTVRACVQEVG